MSGAEGAYATKLGLRLKPPVNGDRKAIKQWRELLIGALRETPDGTAKGWPARYAARRIAWHVLDHAWEIEDRTA